MTPEQAKELLGQIGTGNVLGISGGRVGLNEGVLVLPVGHGYRVEVALSYADTYTVRRVFARAGKEWVKGEETDVYCDEVGEAAWRASCYVNVTFGEDVKAR
jgi:hypothetical protein